MSTRDILATLSMVDATLQCANQYQTDKKENPDTAIPNLIFNATGSLARIGMADHMARHGNYFGYALNSLAPYTDRNANLLAMSAPYMMAPMMGGFWGGGCMPMMPMAPMMPWGGFGWGGGHHHHCGGGSFTSINIRC